MVQMCILGAAARMWIATGQPGVRLFPMAARRLIGHGSAANSGLCHRPRRGRLDWSAWPLRARCWRAKGKAVKGLVFREYLDMVEQRFSPALADRMIEMAQVPSGGAYTNVGTYHHGEMVQLVGALSTLTGLTAPALLRAFGHHLAARFAALYPAFFEAQPTMFGFLGSVDSVIHAEVRKIYPDAELPRFDVLRHDEDGMTLVYFSSRHLGDLAHGLIEGVALHYGQAVSVRPKAEASGSVIFEVVNHADVTPA